MDGLMSSTSFDPDIVDKIRKALEAALPGKTIKKIHAVSSYDIDTNKTTTKVDLTIDS
jgi:hypothetical protein